MKKEQLKEVIRNVVAQKLAEAKGDAPRYGYIISGKRSEDPSLQLIGYGNMPASMWKRKLQGYAEELLKRIKDEDWNTAAYFMEKNSVFNTAVNMMKEIYVKDLKEIDVKSSTGGMETSSQSDMKDQAAKADPTLQAKQEQLKNIQADVQKMEDEIKKRQGAIKEREKSIEQLNRKDNMKISNLERKRRPQIIKKQKIEADIAKKTEI